MSQQKCTSIPVMSSFYRYGLNDIQKLGRQDCGPGIKLLEDDYQQRNASIRGGMGGWEVGKSPTSHDSISMWTGMPLPPLFKTLPWQTIAFMTKPEIFTMASRPWLTCSHHNGPLPVLQFHWALLTWCFFRCCSFHLKCCHLAIACSFNRCQHKDSCFREDHPDLHLTPFVLNRTYNAFT